MFSGFLYVKNEKKKVIKYIQSLIVQYSSNTWYVEMLYFSPCLCFVASYLAQTG